MYLPTFVYCCRVRMDVTIRKVHKDSARRDAMMPSYPCFITICGVHNHSTSSADALKQLRVLPGTKDIFEKYFHIGMTSAQAARYHTMKLNLVDDLVGQASNAVNPTHRTIAYMRAQWLKKESWWFEHRFPWCVDQLNTAVIPLLCSGPVGALPLAVLFTSSLDEATLTKGFCMIKDCLGPVAFYGKGAPDCFMTDNCDAERNALKANWPTAQSFLCIFHVLQQVWRWLLDGKHGIDKDSRQELMGLVKSLVYAKSPVFFMETWEKFQNNSLVKRNSNFLRCKAFNTAQLVVFMVEIFDVYMRQRLVDVALGRRRVKNNNIGTVSMQSITSLGVKKFIVKSQTNPDESYDIDLSIGMCTCPKGKVGLDGEKYHANQHPYREEVQVCREELLLFSKDDDQGA
ncbi:hypothetical protein GWK47_028495 [Chionoecetes opilio]|uniref:MULE transposase domain-containing protein n=1 Tax=Chionoecetes opilio TaxID=41210 RepID=A0A8J5D2F4_CHIOP|nr:hypothetical protein GWK47_028495 [Chionoecetes opilio]